MNFWQSGFVFVFGAVAVVFLLYFLVSSSSVISGATVGILMMVGYE